MIPLQVEQNEEIIFPIPIRIPTNKMKQKEKNEKKNKIEQMGKWKGNKIEKREKRNKIEKGRKGIR